jgi:hypothetical protein
MEQVISEILIWIGMVAVWFASGWISLKFIMLMYNDGEIDYGDTGFVLAIFAAPLVFVVFILGLILKPFEYCYKVRRDLNEVKETVKKIKSKLKIRSK